MKNCAVIIPIHKLELTSDEFFSVKKSLPNLSEHDIYWIAPTSLNIDHYVNNFGIKRIERFEDVYFADIKGYNRLLVSNLFYERFLNYEFILICQTDAIVLKNELHLWIEKPYDYIGAPWPNGYSFTLHTKLIPIAEGVKCTAFVGNGGLSLRRVKACINLIQEYLDISKTWDEHGHAEDLFFSFVGTLSSHFMIPNIMTAASFSHDIDPNYLQKFTNFNIPFGVHAWGKYDRELWTTIFNKI